MNASALRGSGAVLTIPFLPAIEAVLAPGFAWAVIDAEHSPLTRADQMQMIAAAQRLCPLVAVRVRRVDDISDVLDAGADGVVVPMVDSAAQARTAVAATHHPPDGARSLGPYRAPPGTATVHRANRDDHLR